jgi:hypothetical protein
MAITRNNELKFQGLCERHPFYGKGSHVEHSWIRHLWW